MIDSKILRLWGDPTPLTWPVVILALSGPEPKRKVLPGGEPSCKSNAFSSYLSRPAERDNVEQISSAFAALPSHAPASTANHP